MNAVEFVKKFGKAVAVNLHNKSRGCKLSEVLFYDSKNDKYECVDSEDLKQIVDAWGLVERFGGIEHAKNERDFRREQNILQRYDAELSAAINLMEKCL